ncbi:DUF222 domain-containing protein [Microbacterium sp. RD1]|uniref:HNH endonuclease signature motif containing protein n=1 Tax=Microbacterium sp. RD1 TaxID=3457313 RepID=UPI003FA53DD7
MADSRHTPLADDIRAGLHRLIEGFDLALASDDALLAHTGELEELGRLVDAARVRAAGEIADRSRSTVAADGLAHRLGCRNASELLERVTRVSAATASLRIRTAQPLRPRQGLTGEELPAAFPEVSRALASGALGVDAASAIVAALAPIAARGAAEPGALAAAETELVAAATGAADTAAATADDVTIMARTWALFLDPDGTLGDEHQALRHRFFTLGRLRDGVIPVRGGLLPEIASQLETLLDAVENPRTRAPRFRPDGADPDRDDDLIERRTPAQRRHDALASILTIAAGVETAPVQGGAPPTLIVTVAAEELSKPDGVAFLPARHPDQTDATPAAAARRVGCAGQIQRVVLDGLGRVIDLGSPQRIFTAHQRRAIGIRDGECVIAGCHVPAAWCEIHHVAPAAAGGPTHIDNGVLLCWFHHRTIDTGGWEIRMIRGVPWVKAPRWIDHTRRWRPASGSPVRRLQALAGAPPPRD